MRSTSAVLDDHENGTVIVCLVGQISNNRSSHNVDRRDNIICTRSRVKLAAFVLEDNIILDGFNWLFHCHWISKRNQLLTWDQSINKSIKGVWVLTMIKAGLGPCEFPDWRNVIHQEKGFRRQVRSGESCKGNPFVSSVVGGSAPESAGM